MACRRILFITGNQRKLDEVRQILLVGIRVVINNSEIYSLSVFGIEIDSHSHPINRQLRRRMFK